MSTVMYLLTTMTNEGTMKKLGHCIAASKQDATADRACHVDEIGSKSHTTPSNGSLLDCVCTPCLSEYASVNVCICTFARGAKQFVVHEALDTTSMLLLSYFFSFTPITNIGASLDGAEMMTWQQRRLLGLQVGARAV